MMCFWDQKVKGQGHRVKNCNRRSSVAVVNYALYRVPNLELFVHKVVRLYFQFFCLTVLVKKTGYRIYRPTEYALKGRYRI